MDFGKTTLNSFVTFAVIEDIVIAFIFLNTRDYKILTYIVRLAYNLF